MLEYDNFTILNNGFVEVRFQCTVANHVLHRNSNGAFTLPKNETETETDKNYTEPNGQLCCHFSPCTMNTNTQSYATHFLSVLLSGSVNTPQQPLNICGRFCDRILLP